MRDIDSRVLHKLVHFQATIMYALYALVEQQQAGETGLTEPVAVDTPTKTDLNEVREFLARRMQEARDLMQEINVDLQKEHDRLMAQVSQDLGDLPRN